LNPSKPKTNIPPQSMEVAKRLNRGNKTKANNHQRLNQNNGCVIADKSLESMNMNIFTQFLRPVSKRRRQQRTHERLIQHSTRA